MLSFHQHVDDDEVFIRDRFGRIRFHVTPADAKFMVVVQDTFEAESLGDWELVSHTDIDDKITELSKAQNS